MASEPEVAVSFGLSAVQIFMLLLSKLLLSKLLLSKLSSLFIQLHLLLKVHKNTFLSYYTTNPVMPQPPMSAADMPFH
jgi:hypothetical protein